MKKKKVHAVYEGKPIDFIDVICAYADLKDSLDFSRIHLSLEWRNALIEYMNRLWSNDRRSLSENRNFQEGLEKLCQNQNPEPEEEEEFSCC